MMPKVGLVFEHTRWLDESHAPLLMRVTRIARGIVYYRDLTGGCPTCCDVDSFSDYARTLSNASQA